MGLVSAGVLSSGARLLVSGDSSEANGSSEISQDVRQSRMRGKRE